MGVNYPNFIVKYSLTTPLNINEDNYMYVITLGNQEHNFYKLFFFFFQLKSYQFCYNNLTCFSFLICAIFSPSGSRLTAIFMGKWLILYERSVTYLYDQAIKFCMHCLEM